MLKNLVKENKDRAVEKNGACRFCGQIKLVEALEEFNEDELNELATEQCNCYEAQNYTSRLYRKEKADCKKYKSDYFKCEKPCERAKMCKRNDEQLLKMLRGGAADGD